MYRGQQTVSGPDGMSVERALEDCLGQAWVRVAYTVGSVVFFSFQHRGLQGRRSMSSPAHNNMLGGEGDGELGSVRDVIGTDQDLTI